MTTEVTLRNRVCFSAATDESILEAARRQGIVLEHSCRDGRCGVCKARVTAGETVMLQPEPALTPEESGTGWILTCVRYAAADTTLDIEDLGRLADIAVKTLPCRIDSLQPMAPDIVRITLRLPPTADFRYLPGQYVDVIGPEGVRRSYSLATAPLAGRLELHVRAVPGGVLSEYWFARAQPNDLLRFEGPFGTFCRREAYGKTIFLVTGTGFAPAHAMLQELASTGHTGPVWLYWGGRTPSDLYHPVEFPGLDLHYVPVLSRAGDDWTGNRGHIQDAALHDHGGFGDAMVYACGSDAMIHSARRQLLAAGLPPHHFHSDAFLASN